MVRDSYGLQVFDDAVLMTVVMMPEVCKMWECSRRKVENAIFQGAISARLSITGGGWLINFESVVEAWGEPVNDLVGKAFVDNE